MDSDLIHCIENYGNVNLYYSRNFKEIWWISGKNFQFCKENKRKKIKCMYDIGLAPAAFLLLWKG